MTGKELIGGIAAICVTLLLYNLGSKAINHKAEIERIKQISSTVTDVQRNTANAVIEVLNSQQYFYRIALRQNFDTLKINNIPFTHEELRDIVKIERPRHPVENKIYSGNFRITNIHLGDDTVYLDVIRTSDGVVIKYVNLLANIIGTNDYQWFKDSSRGREVEMTIVTVEKKGEIISSFLQSFTKE